MIHSTLEGSARYEGLHPLFKEAFDYIKTHDLLALESQRIELRGEDLFINRMDAPSQIYQPLEAHEEHIDIQVLLKGRERISYVDLVPGDFVILYPEDAHAPLIGGGGAVSKLVVKIRLH